MEITKEVGMIKTMIRSIGGTINAKIKVRSNIQRPTSPRLKRIKTMITKA